MTSAEQLKDICQRFNAHVRDCEVCALAYVQASDYMVLKVEIFSSRPAKICSVGKDIFWDIFA